ncbi:hypothetical protein LTR10_003626 [Elasticomyces elasticus]|nr:hypothetical protein LTR10_003626 [Elasticomyces elasticus]
MQTKTLAILLAAATGSLAQQLVRFLTSLKGTRSCHQTTTTPADLDLEPRLVLGDCFSYATNGGQQAMLTYYNVPSGPSFCSSWSSHYNSGCQNVKSLGRCESTTTSAGDMIVIYVFSDSPTSDTEGCGQWAINAASADIGLPGATTDPNYTGCTNNDPVKKRSIDNAMEAFPGMDSHPYISQLDSTLERRVDLPTGPALVPGTAAAVGQWIVVAGQTLVVDALDVDMGATGLNDIQFLNLLPGACQQLGAFSDHSGLTYQAVFPNQRGSGPFLEDGILVSYDGDVNGGIPGVPSGPGGSITTSQWTTILGAFATNLQQGTSTIVRRVKARFTLGVGGAAVLAITFVVFDGNT